MKDTISTAEGFSAHVDFEDLEKLGWDFSQLYKGVAAAQGISMEEAEAWEKENYHVRLFNNGNGVKWIPSHNQYGDQGDCEDPGDDKKTEYDIQHLYNNAGLWEVFEGE